MMRLLPFAAIVGVVVGGARTWGEDAPASHRQYAVCVSIKAGNPAGRRETDALRVLAEPVIVTTLERPAAFHAGGTETLGGEPVEHGARLKVRLSKRAGQKIDLQGSIEVSNLLARDDGFAAVQSVRVVFDRTVILGETAILGLGEIGAEKRWVEITVSEATPHVVGCESAHGTD